MRNPIRIHLAALLVCCALWPSLARAQDYEEMGQETQQPYREPDKKPEQGKKPEQAKTPPIAKIPRSPADPPPHPVKLPPGVAQPGIEKNCVDRIDNDGNGLVDCADSDCEGNEACQPAGVKEATNALCSDMIDNDGNGKIDCEDPNCQRSDVTVCKGSWRGEVPGVKGRHGNRFSVAPWDEGISVDQMIGRFGDRDGERNDITCSDGIDNDGDGKIDCADFGCRFDPQVTVCNPQPSFRVSIVGQVEQNYRAQDTNPAHANLNQWDTRFSLLYLRFLGPIGNIENSFYLIDMRLEKTPRLVFAMFQLPLGNLGHYVNLNSGQGNLTSQLIISPAKHLLMAPAYFVFNAFEQGDGAALEFGGPIDSKGRVNFRVFGAGGAGTFSGSVGGRFISDVSSNYSYSAGGQLQFNIAGYYNRFDNPFLYNPVPLKIAVLAGAKYDQRAEEHYPAWNGLAVIEWWHFYLTMETYWKRELTFGSTQYSYLATLEALLWPRHLVAAADFGEFVAGNLDCQQNPTAYASCPVSNSDFSQPQYTDLKKERDERQFRAALHWYVYEQTGRLSLLYKYDQVFNGRFAADGYKDQELSLFATYWF